MQHGESVNRETNRINEHIVEMAKCAEASLRDSVKALLDIDHTLSYGIILRDQYIDQKEKEIDRLCLEFIVTQQPVAQQLRFVYAVIKLVIEIERVGDYAESIARQILKLKHGPEGEGRQKIIRLADHAISMFHDATQAFLTRSPDLARAVIAAEYTADTLREECLSTILTSLPDGPPPLPFFNIIRRFERVADQACNICMETLYLCTGEFQKHPGTEAFRILFIDEHNSMRGRIAESVGNGLKQPGFIFASAGIDPRPIDQRTADFLKSKGCEVPATPSRLLSQIPNLDYYHVIIVFASEAKGVFPREPRKTIYLDWEIEAPSLQRDNEEMIARGYEAMFEFITAHVTNLVNAVTGSLKTQVVQ